MGFRDEKQRAMVCHALMRLVRQEKLFLPIDDIGSSGGPSGNAMREFTLILEGGSHLSRGEKTMLSLAWYFWNGYGNVPIGDIMALEPSLVEAIGTLISASSGKNPLLIDQWIDAWKGVDTAADYFAS